MKKMLPKLSVGLLFLIGLALLLYPTVSNWLAEQNSSAVIREYNLTVTEMNTQTMNEERQKAKEYNDSLSGAAVRDPFIPESGMVLPENYTSVLNLNNIIGYIEIPKIDVYLPIRHGTSEEILREGVGHLKNTAFPIGGINNHVVLTGHRGLSSAKFFTDLDKLELGDVFYLHVLDETLAYQVDQILVVEPEDTQALRPVQGKDYVSLVTCTPYAINSHRLLVRSVRIPYTGSKGEHAEENTVNSVDRRIVIIVVFIILLVMVFCIYTVIHRYRKRNSF